MTATLSTPDVGPSAASVRQRSTSWVRGAGYVFLAALAYIPILRTAPGRVVADTKSYLYLDPGRLLGRAASVWDPNIGLGTVTHQNIGYLFPMGPYYWVMHTLGMSAWISQRIWLGTIFLFAGLGVLYLMRTLSVRGPGVPVATLLFMLTPYSLNFASRLSVILLPWAGLPWILALVIRALRDDRGWTYPAVFAIVVQIIGSVNATALVFAGLAPALWVVYAVFVTHEIEWQRAVKVVLKIGLLTVLASLWWIVGLSVQSGYGLDILNYTETVETVSQSSSPNEVLRGLGYWFFYGIDKLGPWTAASVGYTQHLWLLAVSYGIPVLAMVAAAFVRWRHRAFFVLIVVVGVIAAVGANPYEDPSVLGGWFKSFARSSDFGLALRSTGRAVPLIVLGVAILIGLGVNAAARAWSERGMPTRGIVLASLVCLLAIANLPALWNGDLYGANLQRNEDIPDYWTQAIAAIDARPHDTRVLEIPGADFAAYRWGQTVDPITPGLTDRPYVARELVPWGSPASANLVNALDRRMQEGVLDPAALAPIARLMSAGDILLRSDLQTDRFNLVRPRPLWLLLTDPRAPGLGKPEEFGHGLGPALTYPQIDELALALPAGATEPPPVAVFPVLGTPPIVHAAPAASPLIVSGDGEGLVDLANLGALDGRVSLYSASYADDLDALRAEAAQPRATLVVTDTNRKRGQRWGSIRDVTGATERVDESALTTDERDNRLDLFPDAPLDAYTVVETAGVKVSTTRYGNNDTYIPEARGDRAFDGDVITAWQVGERTHVIGEKLRLDVARAITADHLNLVQPLVGRNDRYLTQLTLTFDGKHPITVDLHEASRTAVGENVRFPKRTFRRIELTVAGTNVGDSAAFPFSNGVGLAEVRLRTNGPDSPFVRANEIVRMPTDLVDAVGPRAVVRPLVYVMNRSRTIVVPPRTSSDEIALVRKLRVPDARSFDVRGTARLSSAAPDPVLDSVLGLPDATAGGITVTSSERLAADVAARGSAAFDGDPTTAWSPGFRVATPEAATGEWVQVVTPQPVTFDHLDLRVVADGRHSVPTEIRVDAGGESRTVDLPSIKAGRAENAVVSVPVSFDALSGDTVKVTVTETRPVTTNEYHDNQLVELPVAIAEVGIPGVQRAALPAALPDQCRTDLLSVDGAALGVRLSGSTADADAGRPVDLERCDPAGPSLASGSPPLTLDTGNHVVRSTPGVDTGVDVDGLVLGSNPGGDAMTLGVRGALPAAATTPSPPASPRVRVLEDGRTKIRVKVEGATPGTPFWMVLGESSSKGWRATVAGHNAGGSVLVNGYANGWRVNPTSKSFDVTLTWVPQQRVWIAIAVSAIALLVCAFLAVWGFVALRRRRRAGQAPDLNVAFDGEDRLANPFVAPGRRPTWIRAVVGAFVVGIVGAVCALWWIGVVAAGLVLLVAFRPRWRPLLTVGAPLALGWVAAYVIVSQYRHAWVSDLDWPGRFQRFDELAWLAVLLLAADTTVELIRDRRAKP